MLIKKNETAALISVTQWVGRLPANHRVHGSSNIKKKKRNFSLFSFHGDKTSLLPPRVFMIALLFVFVFFFYSLSLLACFLC